ncbi:hypothetical protein KL906_005308 [Ogataea polymorpha]|uniref:uncharacterized protein n=1 Tax=Ogataea polymorpha TaxID=460523 RepID=UPI0007F37236|nr:uncharacterized protein OGAPODRAFT_78207 [Ogataea polymorpha]KAG7905271.1 hypothetical protein KL906_005308 [Ogataea polymorpha]KAG7929250.1 hypothetical protein KL934_005308 [Ogataea polymorpha]OBA13851.1 hypothetical protein OGAPODRAFT_78207 [Ogataea polymorpha]
MCDFRNHDNYGFIKSMNQREVSDLIVWSQSNGCKISENIEFRLSANGVSAFLKNPELPSEPSVFVPTSMIISPRIAYCELELGESANPVIALKLLLCRWKSGREHQFGPYIACLPLLRNIGSPLAFSSEELTFLSGTNMYHGVLLKRKQLIAEYRKALSYLKVKNPTKYEDYDQAQFFKTIMEETSNKCQYPPSFAWFLWAHLIVTSRSFPYKLIDPEASNDSVMLLPIIDLFNHKPRSKVTWVPSSAGFELRLQGGADISGELFNNYGPKGNEELLMGYGFAIVDNENEQLQLTIDVNGVCEKCLQMWQVPLLQLKEYTYPVCDDEASTSNQSNPTSVVFLSNRSHILPDGLLELFASRCADLDDTHKTLKALLKGLSNLKSALDIKFKQKLDKFQTFPSTLKGTGYFESEEMMSSLQTSYENSCIYRQSQLHLWLLLKRKLKNLEKELLKQYRSSIITIGDIMKKESFMLDVATQLRIPLVKDVLSSYDKEVLIRIWVLRVTEGAQSHFDTDWVKREFASVSPVVRYDVSEVSQMYDDLKEFAQLLKLNSWSLESLTKADHVVMRNSYAKGSSKETVLIRPTSL